MLYLSVDPGDVTGICVAYWSDKPYPSHIDLLDSAPWDVAWWRIQNLLSNNPLIYTIVERSPQYKGEVKQLEKVQLIIDLAELTGEVAELEQPKLCVLAPGDWKPVAKARKWKHPAARNNHEADAFNLFRYYLWRTRRIEIDYLMVDEPRRMI